MRPGFFEGAALALALSLVGGLAHVLLSVIFPAGAALALTIAGLALAYLLYLLIRSGAKPGRPTVLILWLAMESLLWLGDAPLALNILANLGLLWLIRSLYFHAGFGAALADGLLSGLGLGAGLYALMHTGSLFAAFWCFFLVQALFTAIPSFSPSRPAQAEDRFQHAHRAAEAALRRLSNHP